MRNILLFFMVSFLLSPIYSQDYNIVYKDGKIYTKENNNKVDDPLVVNEKSHIGYGVSLTNYVEYKSLNDTIEVNVDEYCIKVLYLLDKNNRVHEERINLCSYNTTDEYVILDTKAIEDKILKNKKIKIQYVNGFLYYSIVDINEPKSSDTLFLDEGRYIIKSQRMNIIFQMEKTTDGYIHIGDDNEYTIISSDGSFNSVIKIDGERVVTMDVIN